VKVTSGSVLNTFTDLLFAVYSLSIRCLFAAYSPSIHCVLSANSQFAYSGSICCLFTSKPPQEASYQHCSGLHTPPLAFQILCYYVRPSSSLSSSMHHHYRAGILVPTIQQEPSSEKYANIGGTTRLRILAEPDMSYQFANTANSPKPICPRVWSKFDRSGSQGQVDCNDLCGQVFTKYVCFRLPGIMRGEARQIWTLQFESDPRGLVCVSTYRFP
jgi:hypothetical protein